MDTKLTRVMPDDAQQLLTREWHAKPEQIHLLSGSVDVPVADLNNKSSDGSTHGQRFAHVLLSQ